MDERMKPVLDTLMKAQEQVIAEHECDQCGFIGPEDEFEDRTIRDCGEYEHLLICRTCIYKRNWDSWGDPRS